MSKLIVILDNGHGKNTKGKCSPDKSIYEWEWCREIACRVYEKLLIEEIDAMKNEYKLLCEKGLKLDM
mgnify:CR=1 FL=1